MTDREIEFVLNLILKPWKYEMVMNIPVFYIGLDGWKVRIHEVLDSPALEKYPTHKIPGSQKWNPDTLLEVLRALGYEIIGTDTKKDHLTYVMYKGVIKARIYERVILEPNPKGQFARAIKASKVA